MGGLVNEQDQREQHADEDGFFQIKQQGGEKGNQQNNAVHAGGHQTQADGLHVDHFERNEQQYAPQGGQGQPADERGQKEKHGQSQNTGKNRAHTRTPA